MIKNELNKQWAELEGWKYRQFQKDDPLMGVKRKRPPEWFWVTPDEVLYKILPDFTELIGEAGLEAAIKSRKEA